jgi:hypothetical protein
MALPTNGASLDASTLSEWLEGYQDEIFKPNVFTEMAKGESKGQTALPASQKSYRVLNGGKTIHDQVLLGTPASLQYINSSRPVTVTEQDLLVEAEWPWAMAVNNAQIADFDDARNSGASEMVDQWGAAVYVASEQIARGLEERFSSETAYLTGVSGEAGPNSRGGLLPDAPTTGTVGGINRATYSQWRNDYDASVGAIATYYAKLNGAWIDAYTKNKRRRAWTVLLAGTTTYAAIEAMLFAKSTLELKMAQSPDWGELVLHYKNIPILPSADVGADNIYGIDAADMVYAVNSNMNMKITDADSGPSVYAKVKKMAHMCQLFFRSFRSQYVGDTIS